MVCLAFQLITSQDCVSFLQVAERAASEAGIVDWSAFEVAAEAAVAAERARRRAASPGAKQPPSRAHSPESPMHPFAAVAAQNAAREAAATVTIPGAKRGRELPCSAANPFATAAGSRAVSPHRIPVAEAGSFNSVSASDIPQVRPAACPQLRWMAVSWWRTTSTSTAIAAVSRIVPLECPTHLLASAGLPRKRGARRSAPPCGPRGHPAAGRACRQGVLRWLHRRRRPLRLRRRHVSDLSTLTLLGHSMG
jgi:hypothetical protein